MKGKIYKSVIGRTAAGYACHEILSDLSGKPIDYRIVDINKAYESIAGLNSENLTGKLVSEIFIEGKEVNTDLSDLYKKILSEKANGKIEFYSDKSEKWYDIEVFNCQGDLLVTLFNDITRLKGLETELEATGHILDENERLLEMGKSLSASELSYKSLFDETIVAIYIQDEHGVFIDVNPAASKLYGYERSEMIGLSPANLSAPGKNDLGKTFEHITKAFNGEPQRISWLGLRKNGEIFPSDVILNRGTYFGREVVFAMARDNTDLLLTLDALKESEEKYRSLTEQIPVGIYRTTIDGKVVFANLALARILNYDSVEEFLKINVKTLYANQENRRSQLKHAKKMGGVIKSEIQLITKSGELIWVSDSTHLISDKKGEPVYFDGILEDITEARNAEITLKENEANLKAIIENSFVNIWSVNLNYEIEYVNEVFINAFDQTFGKKL